MTSGSMSGGVLGFILQDGSRITRATGHAQLVPEPRPMTEDIWFDLASVSNVIFATERILSHARNGRIDHDAPLVTLIPDLHLYHPDTAREQQFTVRQCLGYQTGLLPVFPIYTYGSDPDRLRAFVLQHEWPRRSAAYSCINFILIGIGLERLEGCRIRNMDLGLDLHFPVMSTSRRRPNTAISAGG
ncbi:serine hydrolase domain-containing protein [Pelagibius sp. Alg239-R121]|uniref:serine hydrolase domain-containing protein n=1 Tax=Pelagibius sp. Alg239-R121 TaxID=2993448 RepID=UPI002AC341FC|nr:serine hydrolase domain-containing protein [Pelagibius sp. Alg239-R121]